MTRFPVNFLRIGGNAVAVYQLMCIAKLLVAPGYTKYQGNDLHFLFIILFRHEPVPEQQEQIIAEALHDFCFF
jgi:hypothetical protein